MEKPTIKCDYNSPSSLSSSVTLSNMAKSQGDFMNSGKPSLLRRVSQSDPHLDIPHFLNAQEKSFNSFHHVLSGLIEGNSSLKVNKQSLGASTETVDNKAMPSSPDLTLKTPTAGLDRNKSALELSNFDPSSTTGGLRKVASIANYNLSHRSETSNPGSPLNSNTHWPLSHHFSHLSTGHHTSSHHNISTIPEDQGLMMSVRPTSGLAASALNSTGVCAGGHMDNASSTMAGNTTSSPPRSGVFGVFGRGFLAKPVIRSDEENYRYIMALDR